MRRNGRPDMWARTLSPYGSPHSQQPEAFTSIAVQVSDLYQVYTVGPLHVKSASFSTLMLLSIPAKLDRSPLCPAGSLDMALIRYRAARSAP